MPKKHRGGANVFRGKCEKTLNFQSSFFIIIITHVNTYILKEACSGHVNIYVSLSLSLSFLLVPLGVATANHFPQHPLLSRPPPGCPSLDLRIFSVVLPFSSCLAPLSSTPFGQHICPNNLSLALLHQPHLYFCIGDACGNRVFDQRLFPLQ